MKAAYIGSFDPITNGHIDIIKRAVKMYSTVVIAIGENPAKKCMFTLEERLQFINNALKDNNISPYSVEVTSFTGLAADFMYLNGISVSIRGVRNSADIEYENNMNLINKQICPQLETIFIPCSPEYETVSSSSVKMLVEALVDVSAMVPYEVKMHLEAKILKLCFIGVIGRSGTGKTIISAQQGERIDFDEIVRSIWNKRSKFSSIVEDEYKTLFDRVASKLVGYDVFEPSGDPSVGMVLNKERMRMILSDPEDNRIVREALRPAIDYLYRKELRAIIDYYKSPAYPKSPSQEWWKLDMTLNNRCFPDIPDSIRNTSLPCFLDAPMLVQYGGLSRVNNNVIIVDAHYDTCVKRLMKRDGLSEEVIRARLDSQMSAVSLMAEVLNEMNAHAFGSISTMYTDTYE